MTVTNYLWSEDSYLEEYAETGEQITSYTNEPAAFGSLISQHKDNQTNYFQFDSQGSTRQLTDSIENITDSFLYDAWGNEIARTGTSDVYFRYVGEAGYYYDAEVDSYHVSRRSYSPRTANWLSADPLNYTAAFSGLISPYHYVSNSPIQNYDPTGLAEVPLGDIGVVPWGGICTNLFDNHNPLYEEYTKFKGDDFGITSEQRKKILAAAAAKTKPGAHPKYYIGFIQQTTIKVTLKAGASDKISSRACCRSGPNCKCSEGEIEFLWEFMETFRENNDKKDSHPFLLLTAPYDTLRTTCGSPPKFNQCCPIDYVMEITKIVTPGVTRDLQHSTFVRKSAKVTCPGNKTMNVPKDKIIKPTVIPKNEAPADESYELVEGITAYKKYESKLVVKRPQCGIAGYRVGSVKPNGVYVDINKPPKFGPPPVEAQKP